MKKELTKKQRNLIIVSSVIGLTALGSALISVPLTAANKTTIVSSTNQSKSLNDNIFLSNYKISDKSVNFNNLIKETNLSKVDHDINLKLQNDINNFLEINNKNVNDQKIKEYQSLISQKAKLLAQEVYDKKISFQTIMNENTKKFNAFPENKRKILEEQFNKNQQKIEKENNLKQEEIKKRLLKQSQLVSLSKQPYENPVFISYSDNVTNALRNQTRMKNQLSLLEGFAGAMTAAAIATGIIAGFLFTIPFYGWFSAGPATTAAAVADGVAAGLGWVAYDNINNIYTKVSTILSTLPGPGLIASDIKGLKENFDNYSIIQRGEFWKLRVSDMTCQSINDFDVAFDPAVLAILITLQTFLTILDIMVFSIGVASVVVSFE